jgi:hypothetical protein
MEQHVHLLPSGCREAAPRRWESSRRGSPWQRAAACNAGARSSGRRDSTASIDLVFGEQEPRQILDPTEAPDHDVRIQEHRTIGHRRAQRSL